MNLNPHRRLAPPAREKEVIGMICVWIVNPHRRLATPAREKEVIDSNWYLFDYPPYTLQYAYCSI
jgi:hypothetical protein